MRLQLVDVHSRYSVRHCSGCQLFHNSLADLTNDIDILDFFSLADAGHSEHLCFLFIIFKRCVQLKCKECFFGKANMQQKNKNNIINKLK